MVDALNGNIAGAVLMGAHGHGRSLIIGSTRPAMSRSSKVPVVLVPG